MECNNLIHFIVVHFLSLIVSELFRSIMVVCWLIMASEHIKRKERNHAPLIAPVIILKSEASHCMFNPLQSK